MLIIWIFQIPLKLINLIKNVLKNNGENFNEKLFFHYVSLHEKHKDLKIEIFFGETHLNCFTLKELIGKILNVRPNITKNQCLDTLKLLQIQNKKF